MAKSQPSIQHLLQVGKSDERCNIIFNAFMILFAHVNNEKNQLIPKGIVSMIFCFYRDNEYWHRIGRDTRLSMDTCTIIKSENHWKNNSFGYFAIPSIGKFID